VGRYNAEVNTCDSEAVEFDADDLVPWQGAVIDV
jgi:hypothetical protein